MEAYILLPGWFHAWFKAGLNDRHNRWYRGAIMIQKITCSSYRVLLISASLMMSAILVGCAPKAKAVAPPARIETPEKRHVRTADEIKANPVKFLRQVADRVAAMEHYRCTFYRQERTGLPPKLGEMEEIQASFRKQPFSVKFVWESADMPYYESVYVEGENNNMLVVRERKGALPFVPAMVRSLDVMFPVKIGKSKNPITDFGFDRLLKRTLLPFDDPEVVKVMTIQYQGLVTLDPINRPSYYLRIDRPKSKDINYTRQDLYFDAETLLPNGTDLYLPGDVLDVRYRYNNVDEKVTFADADFRLSKGHPVKP